jgi:hypothetical protein
MYRAEIHLVTNCIGEISELLRCQLVKASALKMHTGPSSQPYASSVATPFPVILAAKRLSQLIFCF